MRGILLVSCLGMALLGCDDGVEDTDSGTTEMDGGTSGLDCTEVCEAKFMECGAPPMVMGAQCPMVCGTSPTDEQLTCLQGEECPSVMQGVFNGMYPCDITVMHPDSGVPTDSGTPDDAGVTLDVIDALAGEIPLFGVCLGHQSIAQAYGGRVVRADRLMHGRTSPIHHEKGGVFGALPSPMTATRYHSLLVERVSLPECLEITAWTEEGEIMGLRHRALEVEGVQFHPESFLTEHGHALLDAFLARLPERGARPDRSAA